MRSLYFVAIVPPSSIKSKVEKIKLEFSRQYDTVHALKSPPHITLCPPIKLDMHEATSMSKIIETVANKESTFTLTAFKFNAFVPRVIYIDFLENHDLVGCHKRLTRALAGIIKPHRFSPHMTIAFRDLKTDLFYKAWKEYEQKEVGFSFTVDRLCLLKHDAQKWQIQEEFLFE